MVDVSNFGNFLACLGSLGVLKNVSVIWVWWYILAIPALGREKQEDQKFKVIPSSLVSSGCSMK